MINKYKKWDLIKRWEIDSTVFMIVISIMFVISLFLIEELREHDYNRNKNLYPLVHKNAIGGGKCYLSAWV